MGTTYYRWKKKLCTFIVVYSFDHITVLSSHCTTTATDVKGKCWSVLYINFILTKKINEKLEESENAAKHYRVLMQESAYVSSIGN